MTILITNLTNGRMTNCQSSKPLEAETCWAHSSLFRFWPLQLNAMLLRVARIKVSLKEHSFQPGLLEAQSMKVYF